MKQAFLGMFVDLQVRCDAKGDLAYVLGVPDRGVPPWSIAIDPDERRRLSEVAREVGVVAYVQCPAGTIDLNQFAEDVEHDWSGRWSKAGDLITAGKIDEAETLLNELLADSPNRLPIARHALGRCHRAKNRLPEAIACFREAAAMVRRRRDKAFLPSAAGILSDLGVAYKRSGDYARAACCLTWALSLRPNHCEALATFATLFGESDALFVNVCARILAIGGRDKLAEQLAGGYAGEYKKDAAKLLELARWAAKDLDLARWPLALAKEELTPEKFFAALDAAAGEPKAPVLAMPVLPPPPSPSPAPEAAPKVEPPPETKSAAKAEAPAPAPSAAAARDEPAAKAKKPWWKVW